MTEDRVVTVNQEPEESDNDEETTGGEPEDGAPEEEGDLLAEEPDDAEVRLIDFWTASRRVCSMETSVLNSFLIILLITDASFSGH
jgi:hypothetical protein